ncbi:molybdenum cofactor guanylyltransferase MobA [Tropicimonas sp. IMCC6043]|uniref:molybdenum cofactor guanylyltransferase MobA n=1 Tax=Tropicimonas sp. IMCC6043 TaxID=2510645 RepID=UPI00101C8F61|nr:molybdenum cofactor guanylyltransferase MobA [Tropicimonas sp. IMCC6043]RYH06888.1 molybdenum cofactor guanylyltransferase MobA [Tropicimonas sp. IMCC6043]
MREARIPGVILAGGQARRMGGGDKGLREIGGRTLLDHVIARLEPQAQPIALNANGDPARFAACGLPVLADPVAGFVGPLAGILAGLDWAAGLGATHVVSVAADTPFFPTDLVARLRGGLADAPIVLAATPDPERGRRRHPTFGLWPVALRDDLVRALESGTRKVVQWTEAHAASEVVFDAPEGADPFFNVNTPADLEIARRRHDEGRT